jgi:hypothetical protein
MVSILAYFVDTYVKLVLGVAELNDAFSKLFTNHAQVSPYNLPSAWE